MANFAFKSLALSRIVMRRFFFLLLLSVGLQTVQAQLQRQWGDWTTWGQQSDGNYLNPVLPADYSDLDCIRVGDDYYAISSTMQFSPVMTILRSRDLVNWEIAGNAVPDLSQISSAMTWREMNRYGKGIWAGTLRYHDGRFYLYFGTPDEGFFMTSAPKAEGPWDNLRPLLQGGGWDDCSAIWDEEGNAWFVGTNFWDGYKTYIFSLAKNGRSINRNSARLVNEGNGREASKLIYHDGYYYLVFSEHRGGYGRYVMAKRDRNMTGSFSEEKQLLLPCTEANEPNQGGIIEGPDGKWYFLTHHGSGDWSGRIISLLPVTWRDGWPMMGDLTQGMPGRMTWQAPMPALTEPRLECQRSDDFDSTDGVHFRSFGEYQLSWGYYRGDRIGIYNYNNVSDAGYIDVNYLHYDMQRYASKPTVQISTPASGMTHVFIAPAGLAEFPDVTVRVTAKDPNGKVEKVDFYDDDVLFASKEKSPFSATLEQPAVGKHILKATVTDNDGETATALCLVNYHDVQQTHNFSQAFDMPDIVPVGWSTQNGTQKRTGGEESYTDGSRLLYFSNNQRGFDYGLLVQNASGRAGSGWAKFGIKNANGTLTLAPGKYTLKYKCNWNCPDFSLVTIKIEKRTGGQTVATQEYTPTVNIGGDTANKFTGVTQQTFDFAITEQADYIIAFYVPDVRGADCVLGQLILQANEFETTGIRNLEEG